MAAFRIDTAAAIRKLEDVGVDERQAAVIVDLHAAADADLATKTDLELTRTGLKADIDALRTEVKADIDGLRTELKADIESLSQRVDAKEHRLSQQIETGFANLGTTIANAGTEQQRRINILLGGIVAVAGLILAGMAIF